MREALEKLLEYAQHKRHCRKKGPKDICTCGLMQAWEAAEQAIKQANQ